MSSENRYAVLIDADNTSYNYFKTVFDIITDKGTVTYRRIYADWTSPNMQAYKQSILDFSLNPIQQFSNTTGKNSTDSAMIIDAMDILYQGNVDGFCLVSSDSDFTKLASRLRESGKNVIGMGRLQTPMAFVDACNEFKYIDIEESIESVEVKQQATTFEENSLEEITSTITRIIEEQSDSDGWMLACDLGNLLIKKRPNFDARHYGYKKFVTMLEELGFEVVKERNPNNFSNPNALDVYVRIPQSY